VVEAFGNPVVLGAPPAGGALLAGGGVVLGGLDAGVVGLTLDDPEGEADEEVGPEVLPVGLDEGDELAEGDPVGLADEDVAGDDGAEVGASLGGTDAPGEEVFGGRVVADDPGAGCVGGTCG